RSLSAHTTRTSLCPLPLHDALPISRAAFRSGRYDLALLIDYPGYHLRAAAAAAEAGLPVLYYIAPQLWAWGRGRVKRLARTVRRDRKSTRLNSSHGSISYAVFCLQQ